MSLKKFGRSDIIRNAMRANPHSSFFIYDSRVYYDHRPIEKGAFNGDILSASGGISLFEYNVDRSGSTKFKTDLTEIITRNPEVSILGGNNPPIIPYVIKTGIKNFLKPSPRTLSINSLTGQREGGIQRVADDFLLMSYGSALTGNTYPASASITREFMQNAGAITTTTYGASQTRVPNNRRYYGLRNSLDHYALRSPHYAVSNPSWNKDEQDINLISVPKIFYGTRIKPGSMSLKFYITGSLVGELKDTKYNGELIQV